MTAMKTEDLKLKLKRSKMENKELERNLTYFQGLATSAFQTAAREQQQKFQAIQAYESTIRDLQDKKNELEETVTFFKGAALQTYQRAEKKHQEKVNQERLVQEQLEEFEQRVTQFKKEKDEMEQTIAMFQREAGMKEEVEREARRLQKENEEIGKTLAELQRSVDAATATKETIERALECICCYNICPKINQCIRGHIICEDCQLKLPKRDCPTCRQAYPSGTIRNLFAEDLAKTMKLVQ